MNTRLTDLGSDLIIFHDLKKIEQERPDLLELIYANDENGHAAVLKEKPELFKYIKNPSYRVSLYAVTLAPYNFKYVSFELYNSNSFAVDAINLNPKLITEVRLQTLELQLLAVTTDPETYFLIKCPHEKIQMYIAQNHPEHFLRYSSLDNLSEAVQMVLAENEPRVFDKIKSPEAKAVQIASKIFAKQLVMADENSDEYERLYNSFMNFRNDRFIEKVCYDMDLLLKTEIEEQKKRVMKRT